MRYLTSVIKDDSHWCNANEVDGNIIQHRSGGFGICSIPWVDLMGNPSHRKTTTHFTWRHKTVCDDNNEDHEVRGCWWDKMEVNEDLTCLDDDKCRCDGFCDCKVNKSYALLDYRKKQRKKQREEQAKQITIIDEVYPQYLDILKIAKKLDARRVLLLLKKIEKEAQTRK